LRNHVVIVEESAAIMNGHKVLEKSFVRHVVLKILNPLLEGFFALLHRGSPNEYQVVYIHKL
jgi:hypothetical protein